MSLAAPSHRLRLRGRAAPTLILTAALACLLTVSAAALRAAFNRAAAAPAPAASLNNDPPRVVRFSVYDAGVYPREASVEHGRVVLVMEDNTGGEASLVVEREEGGAREQVGRVERLRGRARGRGEYRLQPGRYEVYPAGRPELRAALTVEP